MKDRIHIPYELQKMNSCFADAGFSAYLVGGAVRDTLRGAKPSDWDVATNATPQQVQSLFKHVIPTGIAHGTVTVRFLKHTIEVTTFRTETEYSDGRHPDEIAYATTIEEDLSRRDFTMNAIAVSLATGMIVDPFGGQTDIQRKIIRSVGSARERFNEDGLRPVRAIRFAAQLGFSIEQATLDAIPGALERTKQISIERFNDEFSKILETEKPSQALKLLEQTGILAVFIPELAHCRGVIQADCRGFHQFDVLDHLLYACDGAPQHNRYVRLAALFHDCGKPAAKVTKTEQVPDTSGTLQSVVIHTFYHHESISAEMTAHILDRLRFPKATGQYVCHLIAQHMFHYESSWTDAAVRRFIARTTPEQMRNIAAPACNAEDAAMKIINDLFDLRIADVFGMTNTPVQMKDGAWSALLLEFRDRIQTALAQHAALGLKDLAVNGADLLAAGFAPGKNIGIVLNRLLEYILEFPDQNTKEKLLEKARNITA